MRLQQSIGQYRAEARVCRQKFFELLKPMWLRVVLTIMGLLAFSKYLLHALVRICAIAFLIVWGEICDAQTYELFGQVHYEEYWIYARLLYGLAIILGIDAFMCLGQGMNALYLWMELREGSRKKPHRTRITKY